MEATRGYRLAVIAVVAITFVLIVLGIISIWVVTYEAPKEIVLKTCPTGACPVNIFTGVKDCTLGQYDPTVYECIQANQCPSRAPCVVRADGSSDCPIGDTNLPCPVDNPGCSCSVNKICPNYINTYFLPYTFNGIKYYGQHSVYIDLINTYRWDTPLDVGRSNQERLCTMDISLLTLVANKSCLTGQLTKIGNNYGCTATPPCTNGLHPVWDFNINTANCEIDPGFPNFWEK